jgi:hypothetical protein
MKQVTAFLFQWAWHLWQFSLPCFDEPPDTNIVAAWVRFLPFQQLVERKHITGTWLPPKHNFKPKAGASLS